ncbi:hypothetical protein [Flavobacterium sp.]|jgi:hypothetical protein|uniref:hypothetical protein n=1 Tax=Flavobacterium sp. TaxID=239 RepID=UPI0037BE31B8
MNSKFTFKVKTALLIAFFFSLQSIYAQVPQKMSYQAVIRNSNSELILSSPIGVKINILQGSDSGPSVYSETHNTTTNANGLVSLQIGTGSVVSGTFASINWSTGNYFIKTETDITGGSNYTIVASSELLSVPYAFYSANGSTSSTLQGTNIGDMQYWDGTNWVIIPIGQPGQTLKVTPNNIPQWYQSTPSTVTTDTVIDVLALQATFTGTVTNAGTELVLSRGFCYSTNPSPTVSNSIITSGGGLGTFTESPINLLPNTTYHVRAFSTTIAGTSYGDEFTFTTLSGIASVSTTAATNIADCQATSGGTINTDGGAGILSLGVCYGTSSNPTIANAIASGDGNVPFTATLTNLNSNSTYYYRAFVTNGVGTFYGNQFSFTTQNISTTVTTQAATSIKTCSVILNGTITCSSPSAIQNQGICYSTAAHPTISDTYTTLNTEISSLIPNTTYYARTFATTCSETIYGNEISFTTANNTLVVTTSAATGITNCSAILSGTAAATTQAEISSKGFVYSTTTNPTIDNGSSNVGVSDNQLSATLSCLTAGTYYAKAYATNCVSTIYGDEINFTILPNTVTVITNPVSIIKACSTTFSNITINNNLNNSCVINKGICVSTNPNPTISDILASFDGNDLTYHCDYILLPQTSYYFRGYAKLCDGTIVYGNQLTFSTLPKITTITTNPATNITAGTAVFNGLVIGNTIDYVYSGFAYGTSPNPTFETPDYSVGNNVLQTSTTMINLKANTTYYVRVWVVGIDGTNCIEKMYGNQVSFTTGSSPHVVGENFDGGMIVWLNSNNTSGLIAATTDQGIAPWGCEGTSISGTSAIQGSGQANTNAITTGCTTAGTAAKICSDLVLNGKSDWYLPSEAELILIGNLNYFESGNYWSSTQKNATQARFVNESTASDFNKSQSNFKVRAVRNF